MPAGLPGRRRRRRPGAGGRGAGSGGRRRSAPPSGAPDKQRLAEAALKLADPLGEGLLGEVQPRGGTAEVQLLGGDDKGPHLPEVQFHAATLADNRRLSRRPKQLLDRQGLQAVCLLGATTAKQERKEVRRMAVQDVTVVSVPVSDQERAKAFYVDTLGFQLQRDDDSVQGIRWIQVVPKAGTTSLTLVTWFESMAPGSLQGLVLSSDNLQADYEALRAAGVQFQGPPQQQPWATEAVLFDPDGNSLVLQQA